MYLGIDIGGTKIHAVRMKDVSDRKPRAHTVATPKNKKDFFDALEALVEKMTGDIRLRGIGVGVPGVVDHARGVMITATNIPFLKNWRVTDFFKKFRTLVRVDNDSRCFVRAEAALGAGKKYTHVVGIAVGTGVGGGIIVNGVPYYGSHGGAGEFGQMLLDGNKTFEDLAGKKAFEKYGDRSKEIGTGVANVVNALDPDVVILGGGGVTSGAVHLGTVKRIAQSHIMSPRAKHTPIVKTKLGHNAQAIGAVLLFKEKIPLL